MCRKLHQLSSGNTKWQSITWFGSFETYLPLSRKFWPQSPISTLWLAKNLNWLISRQSKHCDWLIIWLMTKLWLQYFRELQPLETWLQVIFPFVKFLCRPFFLSKKSRPVYNCCRSPTSWTGKDGKGNKLNIHNVWDKTGDRCSRRNYRVHCLQHNTRKSRTGFKKILKSTEIKSGTWLWKWTQFPRLKNISHYKLCWISSKIERAVPVAHSGAGRAGGGRVVWE